jgi:hypothetical protein
MNGGFPPISSSWRQAPWDSRPAYFIQLNTCRSPYVTSSLTRGWVCRLQLLPALVSRIILGSESHSWPYFTLSDSRLSQPGGPDPRIYFPQWQGGPVIPPGTEFPFRLFLRLAGLPGRSSHTASVRTYKERLLQQLFYCCVTSPHTCLPSRFLYVWRIVTIPLLLRAGII